MARNDNLLEGDIAPQIRRLSIPLFWGLISLMSLGVVDTFFVSKLGTDNLSALGFAIPVVMIFMSIFFGLNIGSTVVISRAYGKGDMERLRYMATDNIVFAIIFTAIISTISHVFIRDIFKTMGASDELLPLIEDYMNVWLYGMVFFAVIMIGNSTLRGIGDTKTPSYIMISTAILNALLDPVFIFGIGPIPAMGLKGAAVAIVITDIALCITLLYILVIKRRILAKPVFNKVVINSWKEMLKIAIPSMFSSSFIHVSNALTVWMISDIGKEAVAAWGVSSRIQSLAIIIFFALSGGVSIFAGQNYGAGNFGRINTAGNIAAKYCFVWGLASCIVLWFFAEKIALLFDTNQQVVKYTIMYLHLVPISYTTFGLIHTSNAILNSVEKPIQATAIIIAKVFIFYLPLAWFGKIYFGFAGILLARSFTNITAGIFSHLWNKKILS